MATTKRSHTGRNLAVLLILALLAGTAYWFLLGPGKKDDKKDDKPAAAAPKKPKAQIPAAQLDALEQKLNTPKLETQRLAIIPDLRDGLKELIILPNYTLDLKPPVIEGDLNVADIDGVATLNSTATPSAKQPKQVTFLFRVIRQDDGSYLVGKAPRK